ncbi:LysR family transcriptional regulator [uncultured Azohydromonas sp.]|jgi:Transcriptional regulator|uniref:LysR family transcriptional regulator n=1 Tax=uncultured Azohydromonas sp. TaxID=487342 RepID=UPI00261BE226|nr:LysR family transcriptional regulator [uncultured Azohydromonas sp.]
MSDLLNLRVFIAVAEEGGFASAARRLRLSAPAVTRAVAALEQHLGARLLHRTTRSVRLTDVGERFLADSKRILSELEEAEAAARGAHVEPQGQLSITAPVLFGRFHIAPIVLDFLQQHPKVSVRTLFVDRIVHLVDEGFDVALRIAHLPDSSMTAVQVGSLRRVTVASPAYLEAHGEPATPQELAGHRAIGFSQLGVGGTHWTFSLPDGGTHTVQPQMPWIANLGEVAIDAAAAGHGLTRALSYQVARPLAEGRLRVVLQAYEPPPVPVHLVYPAGRKAAAKVRAFVDFAAQRLRAEPVLR